MWTVSGAPQPLSSVDISITVNTDGGSVSSFMKDVNRRTVQDISRAIKVSVVQMKEVAVHCLH